VAGLLIGSPAWAAKYPSFGRNSVPVNIDEPWTPPNSDNPTAQKSWPGNTNYWGNYVYWMAKHYAGRINQWIIWNEVSIPTNDQGHCRHVDAMVCWKRQNAIHSRIRATPRSLLPGHLRCQPQRPGRPLRRSLLVR